MTASPRGVAFALHLGFVFLASTVVTRAQAPDSLPPPTTPPAINWVLPLFTDKEGWRTMTLRGTEVRRNTDSIAVTDLSITIYSGKEDSKVDTILLSPDAKFFPKETRASGSTTVRLIRDDIEVTGVGWTYDHSAKKVSIEKNVRVVFRTPLNDILK